jgi:hypothetical protein
MTLLVVLPALGACSPYVYQNEINGFGTGVTAVVSSYTAGVQKVADNFAAEREAGWIASNSRLHILPGCMILKPAGNPPALPPCGVVPIDEAALPPSPALLAKLQGDAPIFKALGDYAAALQAITNASDNDSLTKAVQGANTALSGLANAVAKINPGAKAQAGIATAATGLLGEGINLYLNERRLTALRRIVPPLQPAIKTIAFYVGEELEVVEEQEAGAIQKRLVAEQIALNGPAAQRQTVLTQADADVAALNQLRASDPRKTAAALSTAHAALVAALNDPSRQIGPLIDAVSAFAAQAQQLQAAIASLPSTAVPAQKPTS